MLQAVILAGGLGTRMKGITKDKIPKVMLPINGKPFLLYILDYLKVQGIRDIIVCVGFKKEIIIDYFKDGKKFGLNIIYSEEESPQGTGGALKNAEKFISNDKFLLLNGDTLFKINFAKLLQFHNSKKAKITMALKYITNTYRYGNVEMGPENLITNFVEKGISEPGYINGGVYLVDRTVLNNITKSPCSFEKDILPKFLGKGLFGKVFDDYFVDIGVPEDYEKAKNDFTNL